MRMKMFGFGLLAICLLAAGGGCGKPGADARALAPNPPSADTIARIHWLGKERLGAETNAASFMSLWRMPEAAKLEAQTLDKLALAPWRLAGLKTEDGGKRMENGGQAKTNLEHSTSNVEPPTAPHSALSTINYPLSTNRLRPLLDDVVLKESYLEARQAGTNGPVELAFAIRLSPERAALWQTNLAALFESLTGARPTPTPTGWQLTLAAPKQSEGGPAPTSAFSLQPSYFFTRSGDWTLLLLAGPNAAALSNSLLSAIHQSINPSIHQSTAPAWLEADLDLARLPSPLSVLASSGLSTIHYPLSTNTPRLSLRVTGDGRNVHTAAELEFPHPLGLQLEPWNIPTNLVHDPLIGFMAMRGIRPWLASSRLWSDLGLGTPPNQAYFWAQRGLQRFHYMAMPSAEASNQVAKASEFLLDKVTPIIAQSPMKLGTFQARTNAPGVAWRGYPLLSPNLGYTSFGANPFILASFSSTALTNGPVSDAMLQQLYGGTNLIWYDWELTGECTDGLGQLAQMFRHLFSKARLTQTAGLAWLITATPKLGPAVTGVKVVGPNRLTVNRSSTIGLTGVELQVFIDWLESPEFPLGLHTFLATPQPLPAAPSAPQGTNAGVSPGIQTPNAKQASIH